MLSSCVIISCHPQISLITDADRTLAHSLCTSATSTLSSRSYDLLTRIFTLTLTPQDHLAHVHTLASRHSWRDVADTTIKYALYAHVDHQQLIINLLRVRLIDVLTSYVQSIPREIPARSNAVAAVTEGVAATTISIAATTSTTSAAAATSTSTSTDTLSAPTTLYAQCVSYAIHLVADGYDNVHGDVNAAMRLVTRWGHAMTEFPRLMYLKKVCEQHWRILYVCFMRCMRQRHRRHVYDVLVHVLLSCPSCVLQKDAVWWSVSFCKTDDYIDELIDPQDVKLQAYLCRQLLKGKYEGDRERAAR